MKFHRISLVLLITFALLPMVDGCKSYDNFTTFFNTYYNAQRIMKESEEEFVYTDMKRRDKPRVIVPADSGAMFGVKPQTGIAPPYLREYIIDQQKLQPVQAKLDSIFDKGSKIIRLHPRSNYVEGSLYLMAKAFFYKSEWVPVEIKCSELVDKYPDGEYFVDAHLLAAKAYLIERKYQLGKLWLSRAIDVAWHFHRYDILSEAFKISAEQALFENDIPGALRPYRQAIAQSDDGEQRAKWQLEVASLLYRLSRFDEAEREFANTLDYSPDLLTEFEANLYRASSLIYMRKFGEAKPILDDLAGNKNYADWLGNVHAEQMRIARLSDSATELADLEKAADKFSGNTAIAVHFFERGIDAYKKLDYTRAKGYFLRAKQSRSPVSEAANNYFILLGDLENRIKQVTQLRSSIAGDGPAADTLRGEAAKATFALARVYQQLGKADSANLLYRQAADSCPATISDKAKYLYVSALILDSLHIDEPSVAADSIMEIIALDFPKTEYGLVAQKRLGFVREVEIDSASTLFESGSRFRKIGENYLAIRQLLRLADKYPQHNFAAKSLYTVGWIYERKLQNNDSATIFYERVLKEYPNSEYARDLMMPLGFARSLKEAKLRPIDSVTLKNQPPKSQDSSAQTTTLTVQPPPQQPRDSIPNNSTDAPRHEMIKQNGFGIPNLPSLPKDLKSLTPDVKINLPFDVELPDLKPNSNDSTQVKKP